MDSWQSSVEGDNAKPSRHPSRITLILATLALVMAIAAIILPYVYPPQGNQLNLVRNDVTTLKEQVKSLEVNVSALPFVNTPPATRDILVTWSGAAGNYRVPQSFNPPVMIINQGDTVQLTFISSDSVDGHTFTLPLPTGVFQLNASAPGQVNFRTGGKFKGPATGCRVDGKLVSCVTYGTAGGLEALGKFTVTQPGIYRFYCAYLQNQGLYGWLIVLPNRGYHPPTTPGTAR